MSQNSSTSETFEVENRDNDRDAAQAPDLSPLTFIDLPMEIRLRIYSAAVTQRAIHIREERVWVGKHSDYIAYNNYATLMGHFVCRCAHSEEAIYASYSEPVVFKNKIDSHMRARCEDPELSHDHCGIGPGQNYKEAPQMLDLRLLGVSKETQREFYRLLYSSNLWSFDRPHTLRKWLGMLPPTQPQLWKQTLIPPPHLVQSIRRLHLEISTFGQCIGNFREIKHCTEEWKDLLADLPTQLPKLTSLHLSICLGGYVTCWRKSQGAAFDAMFLPLKQLRHLEVFTVVFREQRDVESCTEHFHDVETHKEGRRLSFWKRKEFSRVWAEEIVKLVLSKER